MNNQLDRIKEIKTMIKCLKEIVEKEKEIQIPSFRHADQIHLTGDNYNFLLDLNRKGHKRPKCTFQLREKRNKDHPLVRVDLIGPSHHNPTGDFKWNNEDIKCPHLHRADFPKYGMHVAVPLLEENDNFQLTQSDLKHLIKCLQKTLEFLNVQNIDKYEIIEQGSLFN